jgi:ubiquinone/menaquinone biosynthesis C-methylase UbiE
VAVTVTSRHSTYIHGTEPPEQERLAELNRLTNDTFLAFLDVPVHARVLEVGSGLGILAGEIAKVSRRRVVGVELSAAQIASAAGVSGAAFVQADAHALPFAGGAFDLVFARYLLEHVRDPQAVLAEMRRVLRPGGCVAVMENDISLARFDPDCPAFDGVWDMFGRLQRQLGGDGTIGRRLFGLLQRAGFQAIELSVQPEVHWHGSPAWVPWVRNIIGNVESARVALTERGLCTTDQIDRAVAELEALSARPDASAIFVWNRGRATR